MTNRREFFEEHPVLKNLLLMVAVSAGILIVVFIVLKIYGRVGKEYELPNVVGQNIENVECDANLNIEFVVLDSIYESGDNGGRILSQDPKAGSMIKKGRKVYVTITAYVPEDAIMPNLTDMTVRQAISQLANVGFSVGHLNFVESPFRNAVLAQLYHGHEVKAGEKLSRGAVIDLTVGMGSGSTMSVVPFVIGKSPDRARRDILSASFNVGREHFDGVSDHSKAVVVRQEPDYTGVSQYNCGYSVELWYSDGSTIDVDKMVRDFKVDSSKIVYPTKNNDDNGVVYEDNLEDDGWIW